MQNTQHINHNHTIPNMTVNALAMLKDKIDVYFLISV